MKTQKKVLGGIALGLAVLGMAPVHADTAAAGTPVTCKDGTAGKAGKGACSHHGGIDKSTSTGDAAAAAPATPPAPAPTMAAPAASTAADSVSPVTCNDGSTGKAGKRACGHHGGVEKSGGTASNSAPTVAAPAAQPTAPSAAPSKNNTIAPSSAKAANTDPTDATAKCKDGTYSQSQQHSGSCSHHGGVAQFLQ